MPRLQAWESVKWHDILIADKKNNHRVKTSKMNKCAQERLKALNIYEDEILSLRLSGKVRLYGFAPEPPEGTFLILWYDIDHGDNDTCVYRSPKKYT